MLKFSEFITEGSAEVNVARKALKMLSLDAQRMINAWEFSDWKMDGALSKAFTSNDKLAQEIYNASEAIRDAIRKREGNTITLYRGLQSSSDAKSHDSRLLFSWTSREKVARIFSGQARVSAQGTGVLLNKDTNNFLYPYKNITQAEAAKAQKDLLASGKASVGNLIIKRWNSDENWCTIYHRAPGKSLREIEYSQETNKIEKYLISNSKEEKSIRDENEKSGGFVIKKKIPVEDIIWLLGDGTLKTMEYIVRGHSGSSGEKI